MVIFQIIKFQVSDGFKLFIHVNSNYIYCVCGYVRIIHLNCASFTNAWLRCLGFFCPHKFITSSLVFKLKLCTIDLLRLLR